MSNFFKSILYDDELNQSLIKAGRDDSLVYAWVVISKNNGVKYYDRQKQWVPMGVLRPAVKEFMQGDRILKDRHTGEQQGIVVESLLIDKEFESAGIKSDREGWFIGAKMPENILKMYRTGERKHFSIGGYGSFKRTESPAFKQDFDNSFAKTDILINTDTEKEWVFGEWTELTLKEVSTVPIGAQNPGHEVLIKTLEGESEMDPKEHEKLLKEAVEKATKEAIEKAAETTKAEVEKALALTDEMKEFAKGLDEAEKAKFMESDDKAKKKQMDDAKKAVADAATKSGEFVSKADFEAVQKQLKELENAKAEKEAENARKEFIEKELGSIEAKPAVKEAFAKTALAIEDEEARKDFVQTLKSSDGIVKLGKEAQGVENPDEPKTMTAKEYAEALELKVNAKVAKGADIGTAMAEAETEMAKFA